MILVPIVPNLRATIEPIVVSVFMRSGLLNLAILIATPPPPLLEGRPYVPLVRPSAQNAPKEGRVGLDDMEKKMVSIDEGVFFCTMIHFTNHLEWVGFLCRRKKFPLRLEMWYC